MAGLVMFLLAVSCVAQIPVENKTSGDIWVLSDSEWSKIKSGEKTSLTVNGSLPSKRQLVLDGDFIATASNEITLKSGVNDVISVSADRSVLYFTNLSTNSYSALYLSQPKAVVWGNKQGSLPSRGSLGLKVVQGTYDVRLETDSGFIFEKFSVVAELNKIFIISVSN